MLLLLSLLLISTIDVCVAQPTVKTPGDYFLGQGFDMAAGTMLPMDNLEVVDSFSKARLFLVEEKDVEVTPLDTMVYTTTHSEIKSFRDVMFLLRLRFRIGIDLGFFGFRISTTFTKFSSQKTRFNSEMFLSEATIAVNNARLMSGKLSPIFLQDYEALPESYDPTNFQPFRNFIARWGTHVIEGATLGGRTHMATFMTRQSAESIKSQSLDIRISIKLFFFAKAKISISTSEREYQAISAVSTTTELFGYGGEPGLVGNFTLWNETVRSIPMPVDMQLGSYTQYLPQSRRRQALEEALRDYLYTSLVSDRYLVMSSTLNTVTDMTFNGEVAFRRATGLPYPVMTTGQNSNSLNQPGAAFDYTCPANQFVRGISYAFYRDAADARYAVSCATPSGVTSSDCSESGDLNGPNEAISYDAGSGEAITGMGSTPNGADRTFKFRSCKINGASIDGASCWDSPVQNFGNTSFVFRCPDPGVMVGVRSQYDEVNGPGRRFSFRCCRLVGAGVPGDETSYRTFGASIAEGNPDQTTYFSVFEAKSDTGVDLVQRVANAQPLLSRPTGVTPVASITGLHVWEPLCFQGYSPLGQLVSPTATPPSLDGIACLHDRCVTPCLPGRKVYERNPLQFYLRNSSDGDHTVGTFVVGQNGVVPNFVRCIRAGCLVGDVNMTEASQAIAVYWDQSDMNCTETGDCVRTETIVEEEDNSLAIGLGVGLTLVFCCIIAVLLVLLFVHQRKHGRKFLSRPAFLDKRGNADGSARTLTHSGANPFSNGGGDYRVGATCVALYAEDGQFYNGIIDSVDKDRCLIRWTGFDGTREWVSKLNVTVSQ